MRTLTSTLALVISGVAAPLSAQTNVYLGVGASASSPLVRDFVVEDIRARVSMGPRITLGATTPIAPKYGAGIEATLGSNGLHGTYGSTRTDLGTMRTASAAALLEGPIAGTLRWRAGFGALHYFADGQSEILVSGTTRLMLVTGLDYRRPLRPRLDLMLSARVDYHRFASPALRAHGFTQSEAVQRLTLSVGLARRGRAR